MGGVGKGPGVGRWILSFDWSLRFGTICGKIIYVDLIHIKMAEKMAEILTPPIPEGKSALGMRLMAYLATNFLQLVAEA